METEFLKIVVGLQSPVYKSVHIVSTSVYSLSSSEEDIVLLYILCWRQRCEHCYKFWNSFLQILKEISILLIDNVVLELVDEYK